METISIRVDEALAREIDKALRPYYSTKTEFIRDAIRDKLISEKEKQSARQRVRDLAEDAKAGKLIRVDSRAKRGN